MNRFTYSLTFSLLCSACICVPEVYSQQPETVPAIQAVDGDNLNNTLSVIAESEDLPIALLEDNSAFVQENKSDQTIDFSETEALQVNDTTTEDSTLQEPTPLLPTEEEQAAEVVQPAAEIVAPTIQIEPTQIPTPIIEPEAIVAPTEPQVPAIQPVVAPTPMPTITPTAENQELKQEIEAEQAAIKQTANEVSPDKTPAPQPLPITVPIEPAKPEVIDAPVPVMIQSEPKVTVTETEIKNPEPEPSYSLNEKAPISSKLFGDSGFAPTVMDKRLSISPEQRAKMQMKKKYDEMDLNQDGVVSEVEFVSYKTNEANKIAKEIFAHVDIDKNGIISEEEYEVLMTKMISSYMKQPSRQPI